MTTRTRYRTDRALDGLSFILLLLGAGLMLFPLLLMVITSLTENAQTMSFPSVFFPKRVSMKNFTDIWSLVPLVRGLMNSFVVAAGVSVVGLLTSSLAAFAFSKLRFRFKGPLFMALLFTMMIPYAVVLIPQYIGYSRVGWVDTLLPIIVPGLFGNVAVIFFLRQYFAGIPDDLFDAAKIDGAGYLRMFAMIVFPMGTPAIAAQGILSFIGAWNDFFGPMIYLNTLERQTVQVMLTNFQGLYYTNWGYMMAVSLIAIAPLIVVFLLAQRHIISTIAFTGLMA
jgi:multiple sugar transport system permease protein